MLASLSNGYVEEGCSDILNLCSGQTIRNHLRYQKPSKVLSVNTEIIDKMKSIGGALSKPVILAIDWHDEMYYGNPDNSDGIMGTQPKKGTHYAYRYATASVLMDGERLTIAVKPIVKGISLLEHVKDLLNSVLFEHKIKVKLMLFDRGYYSANLLRYLNSLKIDYIMQIQCNHDFEGGEDLMYTTSGHKRKKEEQATFRLVVVRCRVAVFVST